jgi:hypothetical protein
MDYRIWSEQCSDRERRKEKKSIAGKRNEVNYARRPTDKHQRYCSPAISQPHGCSQNEATNLKTWQCISVGTSVENFQETKDGLTPQFKASHPNCIGIQREIESGLDYSGAPATEPRNEKKANTMIKKFPERRTCPSAPCLAPIHIVKRLVQPKAQACTKVNPTWPGSNEVGAVKQHDGEVDDHES